METLQSLNRKNKLFFFHLHFKSVVNKTKRKSHNRKNLFHLIYLNYIIYQALITWCNLMLHTLLCDAQYVHI